MRKISELLKKKHISSQSAEVDDKTLENIFFKVLENEFSNITRADVGYVKIKNKKIIVKAIHAAVASEIWRRREKIKKEINELLESESVEDIKVN